MDTVIIHQDFKEFLKLLNNHGVEYLLIGGYAVGYYGYPRATLDMDIWVKITNVDNIDKLNNCLNEFGMSIKKSELSSLFTEGKMLRMGEPPIRLEILSEISGVKFDECYKRHEIATIDGIKIKLISFEDLLKNKKASGRHKDLNDLENLSNPV